MNITRIPPFVQHKQVLFATYTGTLSRQGIYYSKKPEVGHSLDLDEAKLQLRGPVLG